MLFDTVPEGVQVTVHDHNGFLCAVIDRDGCAAAHAALAAARLDDDEPGA